MSRSTIRLPRLSLLALALASALAPLAHAAMTKSTSNSRLTWGDVVQGRKGGVSTGSNPASGAFDRQYLEPDSRVAGYWSLGAGLEYGNVDDLFAQLDDASTVFEARRSGDGGDGGAEGSSGDSVGVIADVNNASAAELDALVDAAGERAARVAAVLAFIQTEGYAMAQAGTDIALLFNSDIAGGSLRLDVVSWANSSAIALADPINFDVDAAKQNLRDAYSAWQQGGGASTFDLSGGLRLSIDPASGEVRASIDNDSLLLTRAAKLLEFGLGWSRPVMSGNDGALFVGVRPKVTQIGLSRVSTRLGDLDDAESAFDDIRNADFVTQAKVDMDLGLLWQAPRYRLGASLINLVAPEFDFPSIDYSDVVNPDIRAALESSDHYEAERQLKLEGAWLDPAGRWGLFAAMDANAVFDPAGVESQWGSLSGGYSFDNFWFNQVRLGVSRNFAGTELSYLSAGMTLLRYVDLDLASTLSTTTIDGTDLPRGVSLGLGFNYAF